MKDIKKISSSACNQFPNALHVEFHQRMYNYFKASAPDRKDQR